MENFYYCFIIIWYMYITTFGIHILRSFGILYGLLVYFMVFLVYISRIFGMLYHEQSGNPG
jgi:tetrahydromethanopterin S-methyltransferase subunit G